MSEQNNDRLCPKCSAHNEQIAEFCSSCGSSLGEKKTKDVIPGWYTAMHKPTVFSAITMAISVLLIFLLLSPFINVRTRHGDNYYNTSFSPLQIVEYSVKSFIPYTDKQILASDEYKEFKSISKEISKIKQYNDLTRKDKNLLEDYNKSTIALAFVKNEEIPKANLVAAAIFTIVYAVVAVTAFISSAVALIISFFKPDSANNYIRVASRRLAFLASVIPVYIMIIAQTSRFSREIVPEGYGSGGVAPAWGLILTLLLLLTVPVYIGIRCYAKITGFTGAPIKFKDKKQVVSIIFAVAALLVAFMPCISLSCATPSSPGKTEFGTAYVSPTEIYEFTHEDYRYYRTSLTTSKNEIISAAEDIADNSAVINLQTDVFHNVIYSVGDLSVLYICNAVALIGFMIFAASNLRNLVDLHMYGKRAEHMKRTRVFMILFASVYLCMSIALTVMANLALTIILSRHMLFLVGAGPVLALIFSIISIVAENKKSPKAETYEFDNPDISSAPYVING